MTYLVGTRIGKLKKKKKKAYFISPKFGSLLVCKMKKKKIILFNFTK